MLSNIIYSFDIVNANSVFFHYLVSPLSYCTLILDLMRNLYKYNANGQIDI